MRLQVTRKSDLAVQALRVLIQAPGQVKSPAMAKALLGAGTCRSSPAPISRQAALAGGMA